MREQYYYVGDYEDGRKGRRGDDSGYVSDSEFSEHCVLFGDTGTGKTRMLGWLLGYHIRDGHSLIFLTPKETGIGMVLGYCAEYEIPPEDVHVLSPAWPELMPGWNPLDSSLPLSQSVSKFSAMAEDLIGNWGPRLDSIFKAALTVLGTHGYTIGDIYRFLNDDAFRESLAKKPGKGRSYLNAQDYFTNTFHQAVKKEANAIPAVLNKVDRLLESDFLSEILTAPKTTLDLASFFDRQQVLLVHLDESTLFSNGVSLLAGLLTQELFYLSSRPPTGQRAILALDEIGIMKRYVEEPLAKIARLSRESGMRLMVAGQELSVLSGELESLAKQAKVRMFFRLNDDDADRAARMLRHTVITPPDFLEEMEYQDEYDEALEDWSGQFTPAFWSGLLQKLESPGDGPGELVLAIKNMDAAVLRAPEITEWWPNDGYVDDLRAAHRRPAEEPERPPEEELPEEGVFELADDDDNSV